MLALTLGAICWLTTSAASQTPASLQGRVVDPSGAAVAGATVGIVATTATATTDGNGHFSIARAPDRGTLVVHAPGFATIRQPFDSVQRSFEIRLALAAVAQEVVVTAARGEVERAETAEAVDVLPAAEIAKAGGVMLDDQLRIIPGFLLFRRSSSLTANPSTQGVSLRGTGASGASRALVLSDGVPLLDPFGGWVYWDRVPRTDISEIEVLRGGGSHLYGSGAMGGVINVMPVQPTNLLTIETSGGSRSTGFGSALLTHRFRRAFVSAAAEGFTTGGYTIVAPSQRGAVDVPASVRYGTGLVRAGRSIGSNASMFVGGSLFNEGRENGTPLQINSTRLGEGDAGADLPLAQGNLSVRGFASGQRFVQTFSAIAADRNSETLTRYDRVPAQQAGFTATWFRGTKHHTFTVGTDLRQVRGLNDARQFTTGVATSERFTAGRQLLGGMYVHDAVRVSDRVVVGAGVRGDSWRDYDASDHTRTLSTGSETSSPLASRSDMAVSPQGSVLFRVTDRLRLTASGYGAFRAPNLQELYRGFRVGNIVTQPNPALRAERLAGAESGVVYQKGRAALRATWFWSEVHDPIVSKTLSTSPNVIIRERENLGATRTLGAEAEASFLWRNFTVRTGYQLADAIVTSSPADATLVGKRVPQVPLHMATFDVVYAQRAWTVAFQGYGSSSQFDDDQNNLPLAPFFALNASLGRGIGHGAEIFVAGENITGERAQVGRTPVLTLGPPLLVRIGVRLNHNGVRSETGR